MDKGRIKRAFLAALPKTLPVFAGYAFLGMTYGIYFNSTGLPIWIVLIMNLTIFSGSAEILAVGLLLTAYNPANAFAIAAMTGARYLFYGISMLDKYKGYGWKKFFLIYESVDETFSINFQSVLPPDVDKGWFMLFVTWLDHGYWIFGSMMGALLGSLITFNAKGLDFVVTAMFIVILLNQCMTEKKYWSELIGAAATLVCLIVIGPSNFLIPSMAAILVLLTVFKKPLDKMADENEKYKIEKAEKYMKEALK